jgi:hypothetical protein
MPSQRQLELLAVFETRPEAGLFDGDALVVEIPRVVPMAGEIQMEFALEPSAAPLRIVRTTALPRRWGTSRGSSNHVHIPITAWDIEELNMARHGQDVYIRWQIEMTCIAEVGGQQAPVIVSVSDSPYRNDEYLCISPPMFNQNFVVPSGLPERLLMEYPTKSVPDGLKDKLPPELHEVVHVLSAGTQDIRSALTAWRQAKNASDFGEVMGTVRNVMEKIRDVVKRQESRLSQVAYLDTGIMADTGASEAAGEAIASIGQMADAVFNLASKPPHGFTKKSKSPFSMYPDTYDAEAGLAMALSCLSYLLARLEQYAARRG